MVDPRGGRGTGSAVRAVPAPGARGRDRHPARLPADPPRVLGVDPGSLRTGWGILCGPASAPRLIASGVIRLPGQRAFASRLASLHREIAELARVWVPAEAAVESPFHGASARSALLLAHARGAILAALAEAGLEVFEYSPAAVKKSVTGNGRADKGQIGRMVGVLLRETSEPEGPADRTDALAVALCHLACAGRRVASTGPAERRAGAPVRGPRG